MAKITKIKDSIITITGKQNYKKDEQYKLSKNAFGIVLSANEKEAQLLIIGDPSEVKMNSTVSKMKVDNTVKVYDHYFGKIITPFGDVIHPAQSKIPAKPKLIGKSERLNKSPAVIDRVKLNAPLDTGILAIDTMIPIGLGQRELIIGDRTTGKTSIALSAIINQKNNNVKSIYVAIGQKRNSVISLYNTLAEHDALENTIVIFANPDSSAQQFLAPTIGMAMAEAIAYNGEDVLVVVDDLTKHANVYREISLSIGRNPGREAYPTDIFFQHSSLLERSGKFTKKYKGGSITALPIVETVQGDLASLIPSNIISITDGQIFTNADSFNKGIFPAINVQLSVSRTGTSVQSKMVRNASKNLKSDHAMLSEIKKFADMSIDISDSLIKKIEKWDGINNLLVQYGYDGYSRGMIVILIEMYRMGLLSKLEDSTKFSMAFRKLCNTDSAAKEIIKRATKKEGQIDDKLRRQIEIIFGALAKAASGEFESLYTKKEFEKLRGAK